MKLVQKQFLKGRREFEIVGDTVEMRLRSGLREEKTSVSLAILNPDPVEKGSCLEFHSRVKRGPLLSLLRDKPNSREFNAFVDELKRRAREAYHLFAGLKSSPNNEATAVIGDAAVEQAETAPAREFRKPAKPVNAERIDDTIRMLQLYLESEEIEPLLSALITLKAKPQDEIVYGQLIKAFDSLGPQQGAVLTYAPYIGLLLSDEPFSR